MSEDLSNDAAIERFDRGDPSRRCLAHRKNGDQCRNWAIRGHHVCRYHGGAAPQTKAAAREYLELQALHNVRNNLQDLADNAESEQVRLSATNSALDRAGVSAKTAVAVEVDNAPWKELMGGDIVGVAQITRAESRERRGLPALDAPDPAAPIDAEVVEVPETAPGGSAHGRTPDDRSDDLPMRPAFATDYDGPRPGNALMTQEQAMAEIREARLRRRY